MLPVRCKFHHEPQPLFYSVILKMNRHRKSHYNSPWNGLSLINNLVTIFEFITFNFSPGHGFSLQFTVAHGIPLHVPPYASSTVLLRVFVCNPPPHVWLQLSKLHELHWQLTFQLRIIKSINLTKLSLSKFYSISLL